MVKMTKEKRVGQKEKESVRSSKVQACEKWRDLNSNHGSLKLKLYELQKFIAFLICEIYSCKDLWLYSLGTKCNVCLMVNAH